jgi:hypothetical protein
MGNLENEVKNNHRTRFSTDFTTFFCDEIEEELTNPKVSLYSVLKMDSDYYVSFLIIKENGEVIMEE